MSRREQALAAICRLRDFEHSRQALVHAQAQQQAHASGEALRRAHATLAEGLRLAGSAASGEVLQLERDQAARKLLGHLHRGTQVQQEVHDAALKARVLAAAGHLAAQHRCDHAADQLAVERTQQQFVRDVRDYDACSDLLLAQRMAWPRP
ncbi:hypothetical protein DCO49_00260 [Stenotrophomonas sp. SPM]|uniref:hypothetical protein n=1 Tax=Stenotrophomonas sp. SPM TaxID=2170735 RepID=UPI000DE748DD|nr:hypothetical protein [Stenotrophomonas sp. SPM]PWB29837.1 hypothetical protein DCO49_00260 [Stenotrophomonas sp. SPM]